MPTEIYTLLGGAGVAGIWVLTYLTGWSYTKSHVDDLKADIKSRDQEIGDLKAAITLANQRADDERRRGDAAVEAAQTSNIILAGIHRGIRDAMG